MHVVKVDMPSGLGDIMASKLTWMAASPLLLLASCGGGESGSSNASGPVVAPTTPPPVASTPDPTPSPSPAYAAAFAFDRDQQFLGQGVELSTINRFDSTVPSFSRVESVSALIQPNRTGTEFRFAAASATASVRYNSDTSNFVSNEISARSDTQIAWVRAPTSTQRADLFVTAKPSSDYRYVNLARQSIGQNYVGGGSGSATQALERYYLFGSRTVDSDIPRTGSVSYQTVIFTSPANAGGSGLTGGSDASEVAKVLQIDHATGALTATIFVSQAGTIAGTPPETATLLLTGRSSSDGFTGSITSADGRYTGSFAGDLFGPAGVEIGLVIVLTRTDGTKLVGIITARRS
jgi:hypothetical protein